MKKKRNGRIGIMEKNRAMALAIAILLLVSILGGCKSDPSDSSDASQEPSLKAGGETAAVTVTPTEDATEIELPLVDEPETFTYFNLFNPFLGTFADGFEDLQIIKELGRRTNIYFDAQNLSPATAAAQFSIMLATDDLPELLNNCASYYPGGTLAAIEEGYFVNVADYLEYIPNYTYRLNASEEAYQRAYCAEGVMGDILQIRSGIIENKGVAVRGDWLDAVGMDAPVTYDDWYDVLTAFKVELGKEGAYGFDGIASNALLTGFDLIATCVSTNGEYPFIVVDGAVKCSVLDEDFKTYVEILAQWFEEGLITKDLPFIGTNDTTYNLTNYVLNGVFGITFAEADTIDQFSLGNVDEGARFVAMRPAVTEKDQQLHTSDAKIYDNFSFQISTNCHDIPLLLRWINYMYSEEGSFLCNWGFEGESFVYDEDGTPTLTELIYNNPDGLSPFNAIDLYAMYRGPFYTDAYRFSSTYSDNQLAAIETWSYNMDNLYRLPGGMALDAEASLEFSNLFADIETYLKENFYKFVMGQKDMSEWDTFISGIEAMNIQRCIDIYQAAYDEYVNK